MVADWLGVPEDKIHLAQADTDEVAIGRGTYASRSMMVGGSALRAAADEVIERGKRFAAHFLEADAADITFVGRQFHDLPATDRGMPIQQVARCRSSRWGSRPESRNRPHGRRRVRGDVRSFPQWLPHLRSELDPETGAVVLDRYAVVDDIGTVVQPIAGKRPDHGVGSPRRRPGARSRTSSMTPRAANC